MTQLKTALLKTALVFGAELRRDGPFFVTVGFVAGLLQVWQHRFKELGVSSTSTIGTELFQDFVSMSAFAFIFLGHLFLALLAICAAALRHPIGVLENVTSHIEARLTELGSTISCFLAGFAFFLLSYAFINLDPSAGFLVLRVILILLAVAAGVATSLVIGQKVEPFNTWYGALLCFAVVATVFVKFVLFGFK